MFDSNTHFIVSVVRTFSGQFDSNLISLLLFWIILHIKLIKTLFYFHGSLVLLMVKTIQITFSFSLFLLILMIGLFQPF